jgi:hypothetical protein
MSNTNTKLQALFAASGLAISYGTIKEDGTIAVRVSPADQARATEALTSCGFSNLQSIASFDEIVVTGKRA